jgi:acyl-CoA hydrolase
VLTGFVSGLNRFEVLDFGPAAKARLAGFFPSPTPLPVPLRLVPATYFGIDREVKSFAADIVAIPVTPFDGEGFCSPGIAADFAATALACATTRIALVNRSLPRIAGAPRWPGEMFTHGIEMDEPPLELADSRPDPVSTAIGAHVARLVGDGAALQLGIGRIPSQLLAQLRGRRGLRLHSGMLTGGVRHLAEAGMLSTKEPIVAACFAGDADYYRWLHGREDVLLAPVSHTHHPATLAGIDALIAVNSAIEVDLDGQVNAEWLMGRQVSGPGGMPDFAAGARRSRRGLSVIALPSTDARGEHSRIVRRLNVPATISRHEVDLIVTEQGIADLRGLTAEERRKAIAGVAHSRFRAALADAS